MATEKKSPEVRFAGFTEDWNEVELDHILTERNELQKISKNAPILAFASGQGVIDRSERKSNNRDHLTLDQENKIYKLTELEDIVYNPSNLKYGAIDRNKHGRGVISPIYVTFTTEEEPSFIELIVKSEKFKLRALQYEEGTVVKRQSVKPENLLSLKVNVSNSKKEQKKIGVFFDTIETALKNHQTQLKKLKNLKCAMLTKMFPQNGASVPEIRFKGFDGEWTNSSLDDEVLFFTGLTYSPVDVNSKANTLVLRSSNVKRDEIIDADNVYVDSSVVNCAYVEIGDIVVVVRNGSRNLIGKHAQVKREMKNTVIGAFMTGVRAKVPSFLNALLSTSLFQKQVEENLGATINQITTGVFKSMTFGFPKETEQEKIGEYFENLDNLITNHQEQLKKLNNIKKACLSKLFVA